MFKISPKLSAEKSSGPKRVRAAAPTEPKLAKVKRKKTESARANWGRLPPEIQYEILRACEFNPVELTRLRLVSKRFSRLVDDPSLWRNFSPPELQEGKGKGARAKMGGAAFRQRVAGLSAPMQQSLRRIWDGLPRCSWDAPADGYDESCEHVAPSSDFDANAYPVAQAHGSRATWEEIQVDYDLYLAAMSHPEVIGYGSRTGCFDDADPNLLRQYIRAKPGEILAEYPHLISQIPTSSLYREVSALEEGALDLLTTVAKTRNEKNILRLCQVLIDLKGAGCGERSSTNQTNITNRFFRAQRPFDPSTHPLHNALRENFSSPNFYRRLYDLDSRFYFWFPDLIELSSSEIRSLISDYPSDYHLGPKNFFSDVNLAHIAVSKISENISKVAAEVLCRSDFSRAMLKFWAEKEDSKDVTNILKGIHVSFRSKFEFAALVLPRHGNLLKCFNENIKCDFRAVALAVKSNNEAFLFAGQKITSDIQSVGRLVSINPFILPDVRNSLRFRPEIRCSAGTALLKLMRPYLAGKLFQDALDYNPNNEEARVGIKLASFLAERISNPYRDLVADDTWYQITNY